MATEEEIITMEFSRWVTRSYPLVQGLMTHFPAGGARNVVTGRLLKDMGTKPGYPDMLFFHRRGPHAMLMIEIKKHDGSVGANQKIVIPMLRDAGHAVAVCYGLDECKHTFSDYMLCRFDRMEKVLTTMTRTERNRYDKARKTK